MPECKAGTYSKNGLDQSKFTGDVVVSAGSSNVDHNQRPSSASVWRARAARTRWRRARGRRSSASTSVATA